MVTRKHPLAECESCPLATKKCAPTVGPLDAKVAVVSRAPGYYDSMNGVPFSGPTKRVLDYLLQRYGSSRSEVLITNVVLCESDNPSPAAIKACKPRLDADVSKAETIIAAGAEAVKYFTNGQSLTRARGYVHSRTNGSGVLQRIVATNNPALVLRDSDKFPDLINDFRLALDPLPPPKYPEVEIIDDPGRAISILQRWNVTKFEEVLSSDLEWRGTEYVCAGFSKRPEKAIVFGYRAVREQAVQRELKQFYERSDVKFAWHNGKSDTKILRTNGIQARVDHDTFLLSYALDEEPGRHSLDYCLQSNFGWPDYEPDSVKHFKKTGRFDYYGNSPEEQDRAKSDLYLYNGYDTGGTSQLFALFSNRAKQEGVWNYPYRERLIPASEAFLQIEMRGFHFDSEEACNINEREVYPRLDELKAAIRAVTGRELLNPNSPAQMEAVYYEDFGLHHTLRDSGKKKFSRSVGKEVRKEIVEGRVSCKARNKEQIISLARLHGRYSKIDKQRGTYIEGLVKKVDKDGKLYCTFNLAGTVSGRTSSKEPNFQNITREGVDGIPGIRTVFLPSPGNVIVQGDLSQAELRTCAVLSGEEGLLRIYRDSRRSLHKERAAAFYGNDYTKEQYVFSKNINFGVTYGQSAEAFAQMYAKPIEEAQAYVDSWWREFPRLKEWTHEVWQRAKRDAFVVSPFGHKRRFHLITEENLGNLRREAVNFLPQNIAGWLTISAIIELVRIGVPIISTVHDSIIADVPSEDSIEVGRLIKQTMEAQAYKQLGWDLPFLADISIGETWGTVDEVDLNEINEALISPQTAV